MDIRCLYSKVKIVGTLLCIAGALTMSLTHSTAAKEAQMTPSSTSSPADSTFDKQNILGCLYLIAAILVTSSNYVLQVHLPSAVYKLNHVGLLLQVHLLIDLLV